MAFEVAQRKILEHGTLKDSSGNRLLREVIPSTMGEPLLYSEFGRLLDFCRGLGLPLNLTTNGSFPAGWDCEKGMAQLLTSCSDIKISTLSFEMGGLSKSVWESHVKHLLEVRQKMLQEVSPKKLGETEFFTAKSLMTKSLATVSLQVTLHRQNLDQAENLLHWAEQMGIHRIKWNKVVLLKGVAPELEKAYSLGDLDLGDLRRKLQSLTVLCGGSLFFSPTLKTEECPFENEVWVWPDGSEDRCPNPERRFGILKSSMNFCKDCPMKG